MADPPAPRATRRDPLVRPLLWRLPLIAFLVIGVACLRYIDRLLQREYRSEAVTQAVQTDALLEGFLRQRVGLLHSLEVLLTSAAPSRDATGHFPALAREVFSAAPDALAIGYLDARGVVRAVAPGIRRSSDVVRVGASDAEDPERAVALARAELTKRPALATSVRLRDGSLGVVVYDPVVRGGRVEGFVAGAFSYRSLFNDALGGQLQGQFAYRVSDEGDRVVAVSPAYPTQPASLVRREVSLPDGQQWRLEVAVPRFQPAVARLSLWIVGLLLLMLVIFLVVREEQRAERLAAHSFHLELLSRDLLDANVRLEERAQQVAEANRAKSRFLANVSHELRTPLNAIVGYNGLALDGVYGDLSPTLAAAHRRIAQAADHLLGVVNDVLDLSKIEVGRMKADVEPVDLRSVIDSVATVIEPIASAKGIPVDIVIARDLPRITTDPRHVRQIVLNLASNAVKFTDRGGVAIVARRADGDPANRVAVTVEDTGVGIAPGDQERIFDEFEQVRPGGRGDSLQRGTGLGLAIARKLARLLGGDIALESTVGQGSRFTLALPIVPPASVLAGAESTPPAALAAFTPVIPNAVRTNDGAAADVVDERADPVAAADGARDHDGWQPDAEQTPPNARPALPLEARGGLDDAPGGD